jgi:hypothetical protein
MKENLKDTEKFQLLSFGINSFGELGCSDVDSSNIIHIEFFDNKKIKDVKCSSSSNYILLCIYIYFFII